MYGFSDVIGHQHLIEHLQSAITMGKVSHAYIFDGEKGSGKIFLLLRLLPHCNVRNRE